MHDQPLSPVSFRVNVAHLPQKGMPVEIEADADQRQALAAEHGLLSVETWHAKLLVEPWKRNGVKVSGRVEAMITQECVVTLEPLEARISEEVSGLFFPEDSKLGRLGFHDKGEIHLDVDGPDSPETFSGDFIDVGAFAEEFFGLAIGPYPRKPGIALTTSEDGGDDPDEPRGPLFEKLKALRQKS